MRRKNGRFKKGHSGNPKGRPRQDAGPKGSEPRGDGWVSAMTGIGQTTRDKRTSLEFCSDPVPTDVALEMWRGDPLAARAVETIPNEMLREGVELTIADDKELQEKVQAAWEDLGMLSAMWKALTFERAYGGAAIVLGAQDGSADLTKPLVDDRVRSLEWLNVLEPREVFPQFYQNDPTVKDFGEVAIWQLQPVTQGAGVDGQGAPTPVSVHSSRLLLFKGMQVSKFADQGETPGFGDSIFTRIFTALRDFAAACAASGVLATDFAQSVYKMEGLAELIAQDNAAGDKTIQKKMAAVELSRSFARAIIIDTKEDFERKATPVTGLPELIQSLATRLAAAVDMPLTLLMGQSPGGMNATGESDIRFFYDRVASARERKLKPPYVRVTELLFKAMGVEEPESWDISFPPLWQPSEADQASSRNTQAQTDQIYINAGVLSPDEVAVSRFGGESFSFETQVDFDERAKLELQEAEEVEIIAENTPPPPPPPFQGEEPPNPEPTEDPEEPEGDSDL